MLLNVTNNAQTELVSDATDTDTELIVENLVDLPEPPFRVTIWDLGSYKDPALDGNMEIVEVTDTDETADKLIVSRGMEGTTPRAHVIGEAVSVLITAGLFNDAEKGISTNLSKSSQITESDRSPGIYDDESNNFKSGDIWIQETLSGDVYTRTAYICMDATKNGAVWNEYVLEDTALSDTALSYGVEWNQNTDEVRRIYDAVGLTQSDFDNIYPWSDIKRCVMQDNGTVAYYLDPNDSSLKEDGTAANLDGTDGQVMVEIPKFYYKKSEDNDNIYKWQIPPTSTAPDSTYNIHEMFVRNGVEKDKVYISAFEGHYNSTDAMMESVAGVQPSTNEGGVDNYPDGSIVGCRGYAQARGIGWEQQDFLTTCGIQLLYLIEYANFDAQSTIGRGVVDKSSGTGNESENTGDTVSLGNYSGMASGTDGLVAISYRGIENLWGNIWKWVDGINLSDYEAFISDHDFQSDKFNEHYTSIGNVLSDSGTYIKNILFNDNIANFLAVEGGGNSGSYLHDYWWTSGGSRVFRCGGFWDSSSNAGAFCWLSYYSSSSAFRYSGARLSFLG